MCSGNGPGGLFGRLFGSITNPVMRGMRGESPTPSGGLLGALSAVKKKQGSDGKPATALGNAASAANTLFGKR